MERNKKKKNKKRTGLQVNQFLFVHTHPSILRLVCDSSSAWLKALGPRLGLRPCPFHTLPFNMDSFLSCGLLLLFATQNGTVSTYIPFPSPAACACDWVCDGACARRCCGEW